MFNRDEGDIPFGVGVLVSKGGLFLCGVRMDNGVVCGPGGHMHDDETPMQAAIRETQEEFGITPRNLVQLGTFKGNDNACPSIQYLCTEWDGDIQCDNVEMTAPAFANIEGLQDQDVELYPPFEEAYNLLLDRINGLEQHDEMEMDGSAGSGNWGHAGRPGLVGGSMGGGYNAASPSESGYAKEKGTGVGSMGGHSGAAGYRIEKPGEEGTYSKKFGENRKYTGLVYAYRANAAYEAAKAEGAKPTERRKETAKALNVPTEEMGKDIRRVKAGKKAAETRKAKLKTEKEEREKAAEEQAKDSRSSEQKAADEKRTAALNEKKQRQSHCLILMKQRRQEKRGYPR